MKREARDAKQKALTELRRQVKSLQGTAVVGDTLALEAERTAYQNVISLIDRKLADGGNKKRTRRQ
jgi:uncharacterized protein YbjQ (UPF0145 family)